MHAKTIDKLKKLNYVPKSLSCTVKYIKFKLRMAIAMLSTYLCTHIIKLPTLKNKDHKFCTVSCHLKFTVLNVISHF